MGGTTLAKYVTFVGLLFPPCLGIWALGVAASCGGSTGNDDADASGSLDAGKTEAGDGFDATIGMDAGVEPEASVEGEVEAGQCYINAAMYDQSCSVDSDCIRTIPWLGLPVQSGDYCSDMCLCGGEAINKDAAAQYTSAVSKTPLGSHAPEGCLCPSLPTEACCQNGRCMATQCPATLMDAGMTGAQDAGGALDGSVLCGLLTGPLDAGSSDAGPTRLCVPPEVCTPFNGGWACCVLPGGAGGSICFGLPGDGGG
jgi:hypothetical protein